jgi:hypothetical protein
MTSWRWQREAELPRRPYRGSAMEDARLDQVYEAPLAEFVRRRNALVEELKEEGEPDEAAGVAALKKPSLVAWALNQAARSGGDAVGRLLEVQAEMRDASSAADLRRLSDERQRLVAEVTSVAVAALDEGGHAGANARDRISLSLLGTGTDAEAAELLRAGRLTKEIEAGSAWDFSLPAPAAPPDPIDFAERSRRREVERARKLLDELAGKAERLEGRAERARREVEEVRRRAEDAEGAARAAREEADRQAALVAELEEAQGEGP